MSKQNRQFNIFFDLLNSKQFTLSDLSQKYSISKRSCFRDLKEIKETLSEKQIGELILDNDYKTYHIKLTNNQNLTLEEVVSISKILLHSRAFSKIEMNHLINNLQTALSDEEKKVSQFIIKDELTFYQPLTHNKALLPLISNFISYIYNRNTIQFHYKRSDYVVTTRENQPVSLVFSEFYFYAMFYSEKNNTHIPYRLDRFSNQMTVTKTNKIQKKIELNESRYKKETHQMFSSGKLITAKFNYWANDDVVLDYFPKSTIIKKKQDSNDFSIIKTSAYDTGFIMWALSQGDYIEILEPISLVNNFKKKVSDMYHLYHNN